MNSQWSTYRIYAPNTLANPDTIYGLNCISGVDIHDLVQRYNKTGVRVPMKLYQDDLSNETFLSFIEHVENAGFTSKIVHNEIAVIFTPK